MSASRNGWPNHFNLSNGILEEARIIDHDFSFCQRPIAEAITLLENRAPGSLA
nr:hypothetical protein [uncultured Cohaesibacter sp.]